MEKDKIMKQLMTMMFRLCLMSSLILFHATVFAQDQKKEFAPTPVEAPKAASQTKVDLSAGPRLNSSMLTRRAQEANLERRSKALERKLVRLIRKSPKNPKYVDRLASLYWQVAGEIQNRAYLEEERCFAKSAKREADVQRCDAKRNQVLQEAEAYRGKAIETYKYIVKNFPSFPELDRILFALAFNYQQKQQNEDAKAIYQELITSYADSKLLADALFNMGDIFFATSNIDAASKYYNYVIDNYPKSNVYAYAVYKLGWCYYNQSNFKGSLLQFIQVIEYQNKMSRRNKKKNRLSLKKEAQRDMVRVYVNIDNASAKAGIQLIKKYAPNRYDELAEKLADLYSGTGQFDNSSRILRRLIKDSPKSYRVVGYQRRITENIANKNRPEEAILALKRLVSLWMRAKSAPDAKPKRVREDHIGIEKQLNAMARQYHNQAIETKSLKDYNTALELYKTYIESFPNENNKYEMNFYYGELLFKLQKWKRAAQVYEKVLKIDPSGKFTQDAAHATLLSYKALLKDDLDRSSIDQIGKDKNKTKKKKKKKKRKKKLSKKELRKEALAKIQPKKIPEDYTKYLEASALYRRYVKASQYLIDIQYEEARVYYKFNHFDKATPLFKDIAENHVDHKVSVYSANLLLECYNVTGNFKALGKQVNIFMPLYPPSKDREFNKRLSTLKSELDFKRCSMLDTRGEYDRAARCFLAYAKRFPKSKIVDKAYFNAALNYDREKQMEKAIKARILLINNVEGSDLVPQAFFQIAKNLQALAVYSKASSTYEQYAQRYPKSKESKEALRLAAQFRLGLGELDQATKNLKAYIKRLDKRKERKQAMAAYFEIGKVLKERKQWGPMINHYKSFTKRFKSVDTSYLIQAYTLLGNAYVNLPRKYRDHKKAQTAYNTAVKTFEKLKKDQRAELSNEARSAVAESMFKLANYRFDDIKKIDFAKVKRTRDAKKHVAAMKKNMKKLDQEMSRVKVSFEKVIGLNVSSWGLASMAQIGEMFYFYFTSIEKLGDKPPKIFNYEMAEFFRSSMIQLANPLRLKAVGAYKNCLKKALEIQWFNEWTDKAEKQVAKIAPEEYRYSIEERGKPVYFHQGAIRRGLVTELPEEEEEE